MTRQLDPRRLAIALNVADAVSRGVLCRLAAEPERWSGARATDEARVAYDMGVPVESLRRALAVARGDADALADAELTRAERRGCRVVSRFDDDYPHALLDLALPPPVVYLRGAPTSTPGVAIVGSRKMDAYGRETAALFARELATAGLVVVSGFALGVDQTAHRAALTAAGKTVAVLGCGVDVAYPRRSRELALEIAERGALISEFALGVEPRPWHFPVRNRLIAALAAVTLVVQAKTRSGALNTAHHALELGRDVFAVPGRICDELAAGTNGLIADGALVARRPRDVLEGLPLLEQMVLFPSAKASPGTVDAPPQSTSPQSAPPQSAPAEMPAVEEPLPPGLAGALLRVLPPGDPRTAEDLAAAVETPIDRVLGVLLELELTGRLRREPGPVYVR